MLTSHLPVSVSNATVADIALNMPSAIDVFNHYHIDYCCKGKILFLAACRNAGLDPLDIWTAVIEEKSLAPVDAPMNFADWEPAVLIDYIIQHHHAYVRRSIPILRGLLNKVYATHSRDLPQLLDISIIFDQISGELLEHMPKEEVVLFPLIRKITDEKNKELLDPSSINVQVPISVMEHEHETVGKLLRQIRNLTREYTPPANACPTLQQTYSRLNEFDNDLLQHIHLENNVLFPRVKSAA